MKIYSCIILSLLHISISNAQIHSSQPAGGGEHLFQNNGQCVSPLKRAEIKTTLNQNRTTLYKTGQLQNNTRSSVKYEWPLRQASGFNYNNYYGISNYVDHNANVPNLLSDYNCGDRTYDLASGYNHKGTDIYLWPFKWHMYQNNQVEVIAAAAGIIVGKDDGNTDTNCDFSNPNWNAVYIQHSDNSTTWYGHLKNGSLTSKSVGAAVAQGEYLGTVASSGSSTGPHLHFEVYDTLGNLVDPYSGTCNNMNSNSIWNNQPSYYQSRINTIMTHFAAPQFNTCPMPATVNDTNCFSPNSTIYFAAYFQDQLTNQTAQYKVLEPNGTVFSSWNQSPSQYYSSSYWYWNRFLNSSAPLGQWTYQVVFEGDTIQHHFDVVNNCATIVSAPQALEKKERELNLFPNPANTQITIQSNQDFDIIDQIKVTNIAGQTVLNHKNIYGDGNNIVLDISVLQEGLYFLEIREKEQQYQKKFLVVH
ncbi:MAG: peptidoglycan DD-metalloendopeptidase family protein [Aureispira sp.]|nr:peptidoglycan DD-metalloendopeptidase family protein [Aureispira sp.]